MQKLNVLKDVYATLKIIQRYVQNGRSQSSLNRVLLIGSGPSSVELLSYLVSIVTVAKYVSDGAWMYS